MSEIIKNIDSLEIEGLSLSDRPIIIAGPCSAESERQVLETAENLNKIGVKIFRAGIWKPRTRPGFFEGVGSRGLSWLQKVKEQFSMLTATEVANHQHVIEAVSAGIDILWIGARTTTNPFAVQEIADTLNKLDIDIPILVKNPINPDLELWIGAIQRLANAGIKRIGAIHRGFSVYGNHIYRNQPAWNIPIELHRRYPNITIFHDPSHIGGKRKFIAPLSQQAMDMGFAGLIVETHCNPDEALSDRDQQITPEQLYNILHNLVIRNVDKSTENLSQLRQQIDEIDQELVGLLAKRMNICRQIGRHKKETGMSVVQNSRYNQLITMRLNQSSDAELSEKFLLNIFESIHSESVRQQIELFDNDKI